MPLGLATRHDNYCFYDNFFRCVSPSIFWHITHADCRILKFSNNTYIRNLRHNFRIRIKLEITSYSNSNLILVKILRHSTVCWTVVEFSVCDSHKSNVYSLFSPSLPAVEIVRSRRQEPRQTTRQQARRAHASQACVGIFLCSFLTTVIHCMLGKAPV